MIVYHVHGYLGGRFGDPKAVQYGSQLSAETIRTAAQGIQIIHGVNTAAFGGAHEALTSSELTLLLGFGYNRTNLHRLEIAARSDIRFRQRIAGPADREDRNAHLLGTAFGFTPSERQVDIVPQFAPNRIELGGEADGVLDFLRAHRDRIGERD